MDKRLCSGRDAAVVRLAIALFVSDVVRRRRGVPSWVALWRGCLLDTLLSAYVGEYETLNGTCHAHLVSSLAASLHAAWPRVWAMACELSAGDVSVYEPPPSAYETWLNETIAPPPFFYVRSRHPERLAQARLALSIVGSRRATTYGLTVAKALAAQCASRDITIVSGGALGVDGAAHRGALSVHGTTLAVLGQGVDIVYPQRHAALFETIVETGALVSEYPPGVPPRRHHFPARNRLIAALSRALIVVEARPHSGTLITAGFAADLGRPVFAVPGSILTDASHSCHTLIREGACPLTAVDDLAEVFPEVRF